MVSFFGSDFDRLIKWVRAYVWKRAYVRFYVSTVKEFRLGASNCFAEIKERKDGSWTIKIDRNQDRDSAAESLFHEAAHIIDFERNGYVEGEVEQHRNSWGIIFSDMYQAYHNALEKGEI